MHARGEHENSTWKGREANMWPCCQATALTIALPCCPRARAKTQLHQVFLQIAIQTMKILNRRKLEFLSCLLKTFHLLQSEKAFWLREM